MANRHLHDRGGAAFISRSMLIAFLAAAACFSCPDCSGNDRKPIKPDEDQRLVRRVTDAVGQQIDIADIEQFVGSAATFTTHEPGNNPPLTRIAFASDPITNGAPFDPKDVRDCVFWARPVKSDDFRVVGVIWTTKGKIKLFFATIAPPR